MADNNLNLTANFHGQDKNMSSTVMKLKAQLKSLDDQMKKFGEKSRKAITSIPMEDYVKQIDKGKTALNGLTKKHYDYAKYAGATGKHAAAGWTILTQKIKDAAKEHERLTTSGAKGHKTRIARLERELKTHYKHAMAYQFLYTKTAEKREDLERRMALKRGEIQAAELRVQERAHMRHLNRVSRMHRDAMHSMQTMSRFGNRAIPYAAGGAAAAGYAGVSAFRQHMRSDTAETKMSVFGDMTREEVKAQRKAWMNAAAVKYGMAPDKMIDANTEVLKAGIDKSISERVTKSIVEAVSGLELDIVETTRMATRLATATGDITKLDPARLEKMLNGVIVSAAATASDPNEVIAANKRSMGVFATTKGFTPEHLSAINAAGIGAGLQAFKEGTLVDFFVNELGGAGNAKGQRAEELGKVARLTGFGSRRAMAHAMRNDTTNALLKVIESIDKLPEDKANMVLTLLGKREWRGEIGQWAHAAANIRKAVKDVDDPKNANKLAEISDGKRKSLEGRWKSMKAAWLVLWDQIGEGFEPAFIEVTDFFTDYLSRFDGKKISDTVKAVLDGFVQGLGFDNWTAMLKSAFGDPANVKSWSKEVGEFVRGFVREISRMITILKNIGTGILKAFGGNDPESMGKATAHVIELVAALKTLGTVASVLADIVTFVKGIAAVAMLGPTVWSAVAGLLSGLVGGYWLNKDKGLPDLGRKSGESPADHQKRIDEWSREQLLKKSSYSGATEFSSRNRSTQLAEKIDNLGGKIERVAFMNKGVGGFSNALYTGGGGGGVIRTGGVGGGGSGGGTLSLLNNKPGSMLPGSVLGNSGIIRRSNIPSFNGSGGSLAGSGGELNQAAYEKIFAGTPMAGKYSQVVAAAKANGISPALLAGVMAHESGKGTALSGNNPGGVMDPATGWSKKMQFAGLDDGISKTASVLAKNYNRAGGDMNKLAGIYAPQGAANDPNGLNKHWLSGVSKYTGAMGGGTDNLGVAGSKQSGSGSAGTGDALSWTDKFMGMNEYTDTKVLASALGGDVRGKSNAWCARFVNKALESAGGKGTGSAVANSFQKWGSSVDPSAVKRNDVLLQTHGKGYMQTGGHVGLATGETRMHNGRLQLKMRAGNDNDSVREHWIDADQQLMVRRGNNPLAGNVPAGVTSQVPPSSMIQNVPNVPPPSPGIGGGAMRGGFGPTQIHINGSSHDPEALATLVQRRVDESMQWRTHDGDSEYT